MTLLIPRWTLTYDGLDITADLLPLWTSITYSDALEGESDEIEVKFENSHHLWSGPWYPTKGAKLGLTIGYAGQPMLPCGSFEIDEIGLSGPPDVASIKALAAGITDDLRTDRSAGYENGTLSTLANDVATRHGFKVVGEIDPSLTLGRITQNAERDLSFLKRVAADYGYVFSVRDKDLIFHQMEVLKQAQPATSLDRTQMIRYSLKDKTRAVYKDVVVSHFDPATKETHQYHIAAKSGANEKTTSGDTLQINTRCENPEQAKIKAEAALAEANGNQFEGSVTVVGTPTLVAGNRITLTGMGRMNGDYLIKSSRHSLDRSGGYITDIEIKMGDSEV